MKKKLKFKEFFDFELITNQKEKLNGIIGLRNNGYFESISCESSVFEPEEIKGFMRNIGELERMSFLRFSNNSNSSNFFYHVYKESSNKLDNLIGIYLGKYGRLPQRFTMLPEIKKNKDLFYDLLKNSVCQTGGATKISIYRI